MAIHLGFFNGKARSLVLMAAPIAADDSDCVFYYEIEEFAGFCPLVGFCDMYRR